MSTTFLKIEKRKKSITVMKKKKKENNYRSKRA